ncbi:MAG: bifunctional DNA-formamidopyrimidine glycosylase/DNA-(apurinic or apyrimidinic site) lyase [Planctomycetaceae bacterium]|nr:bifunctional DNA-formamidopyrimidine glycosylase/DNA-(apurinic or apyrimidinic site) lyase [Planctomycetaceae bacterium]MDP7274467.1 bifunctional DNA-formamidopyrimidine glycosylase/DNA-(apurinic or apyrimidinic site) lyase [Planctomycetaceae bacterium]
MPELPEVETMVRGIRPHVTGRRIVSARRYPCRCKPIEITPSPSSIRRRAGGIRIAGVRRIGKRVVLDLEGGDSFVIEPRMTGLVLVSDPPDRGHLRYQWRFESTRSHRGLSDGLWFWDRRGLGTIRLLTSGELAQRLSPPHLGGDALELTAGDWRKLCGRTGRAIKVALLDQKLAAGIGNLYASEILFRAGIDPAHPADRLSSHQVARLSRAVRRVLREAIRHEGSTLADGTYRNALNQDGNYQNAHRVYDRAGLPCPRCSVPISRIVQAQRSTFYCPVCQLSQEEDP